MYWMISGCYHTHISYTYIQVKDPAGFWADVADDLVWKRKVGHVGLIYETLPWGIYYISSDYTLNLALIRLLLS
jgi:hypothetical protein